MQPSLLTDAQCDRVLRVSRRHVVVAVDEQMVCHGIVAPEVLGTGAAGPRHRLKSKEREVSKQCARDRAAKSLKLLTTHVA
jgi:hypothetical protein